MLPPLFFTHRLGHRHGLQHPRLNVTCNTYFLAKVVKNMMIESTFHDKSTSIIFLCQILKILCVLVVKVFKI